MCNSRFIVDEPTAYDSCVKAAAVLALIIALSTTASGRIRDLTPDEARALAKLALTRKAQELTTLSFTPAQGLGSHKEMFYWFEATGDICRDCSPVLGHFAVNRATGDVWDAVSCKQYHSDDLTELQMRLRRKIQLDGNERRRLSVPACIP